MTSCVCVHMCVCSACNRVILVATAVNGKISMKTDEKILNLVCMHAFYVCMYMLFPLVTSFLLVDLFPLAKSILIMTYSLCCRMQFLLYFINCFAWVVLRRAKANTHTKACRAFSKFVATPLKYLDGASLFSLHCTSLHFRSQHFKTFLALSTNLHNFAR